MCIRDRYGTERGLDTVSLRFFSVYGPGQRPDMAIARLIDCCLLYTSDAADERSSVDLGGRRIIKKKNHKRKEVETSKMITQSNTHDSRETIKT